MNGLIVVVVVILISLAYMAIMGVVVYFALGLVMK